MRRQELIQNVLQVIEAIDDSRLPAALDRYFEQLRKRPSGEDRDKGTTAMLLGALRDYSVRAHEYGPAAREIAEILGLDKLEDPVLWARFLGESDGSLAHVFSLRGDVSFARDQLPKMLPLLEQEPLRQIRKSLEEGRPPAQEADIFTVLVVEENDAFSSPARLVACLEGVQELYRGCAIIEDAKKQDLSVIALDSGSDKSFDFLGGARAIACLKEVILSMWDKVVFFRELKLSKRLDLVAEALPVLERLSELENNGGLSKEQAELVRRDITSGVHKLLSSGTIIPEMEHHAYYNPRFLMAPEPKLLTAGPEIPPREQTDTARGVEDMDLEGLDNQERAEFQAWLERRRDTESCRSND